MTDGIESIERLAAIAESHGDWSGAARQWERAGSIDPDARRYWRCAAEAWLRADQPSAAVRALRTIASGGNASARDLAALADAALSAGDPSAALDAAAEAARLDARDGAVALVEARALEAAGRLPDAVGAFERAARLDPDSVAAQRGAALLWTRLGMHGKAEAALARWQALGGDAGAIAAARDALAADRTADALSPAYVRHLFDGYAARYEADLAGPLAYAAPAMLRAAIDAALPESPPLDILDLGCGTGLAARALADRARRIVGVDLSPAMLERAQATGLYAELRCADLNDVLAAATAAWDLVLAADVLNYVGALDRCLGLVAAALRPGGLLAAALERAPDGGPDLVRQASQRFAHRPVHLRVAAARAGLHTRRLDAQSYRREGGRPVPGMIVVLGRAEGGGRQP
ncbi:MAG: methyltransferase domain-containing protein [Alphaproteobacteria bacterium]|nr:methyltransferase domain-containing protein [Alphaproteobacteria bacterium]